MPMTPPSLSIQVRSLSLELTSVMSLDAQFAHGPPIAPVGEQYVHFAIAPFFAPLAKSEDDREQPLSLSCERIDEAPLVAGVLGPLEDSAGDHLRQAIRQDVSGNAEASLEFLEMVKAVQCSAKDQESPFLADQFDRGRNRALQRRLLEPIDISSGHKPFSPLSNLMKAYNSSKE